MNESKSKPRITLRMNRLDDDPWVPPIKHRRRFSAEEARILESEYDKNSSPTQERIQQIASSINTPRKIITTWFQNRRAKHKRRQRAKRGSMSPAEGDVKVVSSGATDSAVENCTPFDKDLMLTITMDQGNHAVSFKNSDNMKSVTSYNRTEGSFLDDFHSLNAITGLYPPYYPQLLNPYPTFNIPYPEEMAHRSTVNEYTTSYMSTPYLTTYLLAASPRPSSFLLYNTNPTKRQLDIVEPFQSLMDTHKAKQMQAFPYNDMDDHGQCLYAPLSSKALDCIDTISRSQMCSKPSDLLIEYFQGEKEECYGNQLSSLTTEEHTLNSEVNPSSGKNNSEGMLLLESLHMTLNF
ncbi:hypothetical protein BCV72DRAFT_52868 [Rhizopus microsporus var. microsporus]|uniref:Homeobox domain-containing protein n=2 Tax=Rhizopus microsporus TaxID=58291 RepID=A0A2G4T1F2_RHIZD|nr:uncharacterized protein RHIMIDRAFT_249767 [Rhizopus microsporus ATCC 52813]ORE09824.1 hypothetical protein BCV72DRAFT_52868 [Rhizopus microsporus var. microsporus]PHZ14853.1 hypothetical protein RHIMIDRAFT_249767 [Rhizopus microsporus ATCC 52813]